MTDFTVLMRLREQMLRTRVMHLEDAIAGYLVDGDRARLETAYSNEWVQPMERTVSDPFEKMRAVSKARQELTFEWVQEMKALRAAGYSVRTIAEVANVSHDTVWRQAR